MQRIIVADTQAIFREGAVRVLDSQSDMKVVEQCGKIAAFREAIQSEPKAVVIFPSTFSKELAALLDVIELAESKSVVIVELGAKIEEDIALRINGIVPRSVAGTQLVECVRRVAAGAKYTQGTQTKQHSDQVGLKVLQRLTPRELQVVALVTEGGRNREIAQQLGTKEQVIKNYLRAIYDKAGVSDRLELAVFMQHHRALAEAAMRVRQELRLIA